MYFNALQGQRIYQAMNTHIYLLVEIFSVVFLYFIGIVAKKNNLQ